MNEDQPRLISGLCFGGGSSRGECQVRRSGGVSRGGARYVVGAVCDSGGSE